MRRTSRLLTVLPVSLLLIASSGAAHAAKANPWSEYIPAKGVTCTATITGGDGKTESQTTTVLAKSAKKIVFRTSGEGRSTSLLLPGGRLRTTMTQTARQSGIRVRVTAMAEYPSPAELLRHRSGRATMTMTMTLPQRVAAAVLEKGRVLTLTGTYRIAGLGSRSITLADTAATSVQAVGARTSLTSLTIGNAVPAYERQLRKQERPLFASLRSSEWYAPGRGKVRSESTGPDGVARTETQVGCS